MKGVKKMYKIIGKFFDADIERECNSPDYAIGVFMAYVQKGMRYTDSYTSSDAIDETIDVSRDVYTNGLPHYHQLTDDIWLELRKE